MQPPPPPFSVDDDDTTTVCMRLRRRRRRRRRRSPLSALSLPHSLSVLILARRAASFLSLSLSPTRGGPRRALFNGRSRRFPRLSLFGLAAQCAARPAGPAPDSLSTARPSRGVPPPFPSLPPSYAVALARAATAAALFCRHPSAPPLLSPPSSFGPVRPHCSCLSCHHADVVRPLSLSPCLVTADCMRACVAMHFAALATAGVPGL